MSESALGVKNGHRPIISDQLLNKGPVSVEKVKKIIFYEDCKDTFFLFELK